MLKQSECSEYSGKRKETAKLARSKQRVREGGDASGRKRSCLLYTSDAADDWLVV